MILRKKNNGLKHDPQIEISFVKKIDNTHTQKKTPISYFAYHFG